MIPHGARSAYGWAAASMEPQSDCGGWTPKPQVGQGTHADQQLPEPQRRLPQHRRGQMREDVAEDNERRRTAHHARCFDESACRDVIGQGPGQPGKRRPPCHGQRHQQRGEAGAHGSDDEQRHHHFRQGQQDIIGAGEQLVYPAFAPGAEDADRPDQ